MKRNYFKGIVAIAILCVFIVAGFMWNESLSKAAPEITPIVPRHSAPFQTYISAVGIVEASGGNIYIGSPVNRIVAAIEVKVGQKVKEGDLLFRLESQDLEADLASRRLDYESAQANLKKLEALPREEDVAAALAQLKSVQVEEGQAKSQYQRVEGLQNSGAMSQEEITRRRFAFEASEAKLQEAQSNLDKIKAGAWPPDLAIARLQVKQAKALMQRVEADLERTIIRSPTDATILQIKIHEGEFPSSDSARTPSMIIGNTGVMNVRVNINQFDVAYYRPDSAAKAYFQGNLTEGFPLKFLHVEPYFVSKQNLSNEITEKVDTRVLQAIYSLESEKDVYVGQQMDVFIEAQSRPQE